MDKIQAGLCTAHKNAEQINDILDEIKESINREDCRKEVLENLAILTVNLPLVKFALENILDVSGVIVTTDINENGKEYTRYLEDAKYNPKDDHCDQCDGKHAIDPNEKGTKKE